MKKLRIRFAAIMLGMALMAGCAENEKIPVPDLSAIPGTKSSEAVSSSGVPASTITDVSESADFSNVSSTVRSVISSPTSTNPVSSVTSSATSEIPMSTTTVSSKPTSTTTVSSKPESSTTVSSRSTSTTTVSSRSTSTTTVSSSSTPIEIPDCDEGVHNLVIDRGVVPSCKQSGLTRGVHCSACGEVISQQDKLSKVHDFRVTDIIEPSDGEDGSLSCVCTGCGYPYKCTYSAKLTEQYVYDSLISMKPVYPEGMPFDNGTQYVTDDLIPNVRFTGRGCAAFAAELSDKAFGSLPGRYHFDFTKIRVGDIVRTSDNSHSVIVLKVNGNILTVAEGNLSGAVHWGRTLDLSDASVGWSYVLTRYPE